MNQAIFPKIISNWKMNGSKVEILDWLSALNSRLTLSAQSECIFCPPLSYLGFSQNEISSNKMGIKLGAQNFEPDSMNPITGGVSGKMLLDLDCNFIIIGHSERRLKLNENDQVLLNKIHSAIDHNLGIIFCTGETQKEKEDGLCESAIRKQLLILKEVPLKNIVIAYEPVWSIGSGHTPALSYIQEVQHFIRDEVKSINNSEKDIAVYYGGSVNLKNSSKIMDLESVSGLLVGGGSLDANSFSEIVNKTTGQ